MNNNNNSINRAVSTTKRQKTKLMQSLLHRANIKTIDTHLKRSDLIALLMIAINRLAHQAIHAQNNNKNNNNNDYNQHQQNENNNTISIKLNATSNINTIYNNNRVVFNNINNRINGSNKNNYTDSFCTDILEQCNKQLTFIDQSNYSDKVGLMVGFVYRAIVGQLSRIATGARCRPNRQAEILGGNAKAYDTMAQKSSHSALFEGKPIDY